jgi:hypothetical protein
MWESLWLMPGSLNCHSLVDWVWKLMIGETCSTGSIYGRSTSFIPYHFLFRLAGNNYYRGLADKKVEQLSPKFDPRITPKLM